MAEKCKIDSKEYKNLLEYHRIRAIQLHGDNEVLWKEKQYWKRLEKQRNVYRKRKHMQKYIDREEAGKSMKHWCVTERGHTNTRRIHLHGIFYAPNGMTQFKLTNIS